MYVCMWGTMSMWRYVHMYVGGDVWVRVHTYVCWGGNACVKVCKYVCVCWGNVSVRVFTYVCVEVMSVWGYVHGGVMAVWWYVHMLGRQCLCEVMYVCVCKEACTYVCARGVCVCEGMYIYVGGVRMESRRRQEEPWSFQTWVLEPNSGHLWEQGSLSTTESSLQSPVRLTVFFLTIYKITYKILQIVLIYNE